jgi:hypothetical protein
MGLTVAIQCWERPCKNSHRLGVHKEEVVELIIGFLGPSHLLVQVIACHFAKYIRFSNSISLFLNENRLRKLLFNYISLDFTKNRIFLFKVVDPILIINDPLYVSFEA